MPFTESESSRTRVCNQLLTWNPINPVLSFYTISLTIYLLMWRIWWALNNASKGQMWYNSAFKGFKTHFNIIASTPVSSQVAFFFFKFSHKTHIKKTRKITLRKMCFFLTLISGAPWIGASYGHLAQSPHCLTLYDSRHDPPTDKSCHNAYQCAMCITLPVLFFSHLDLWCPLNWCLMWPLGSVTPLSDPVWQ